MLSWVHDDPPTLRDMQLSKNFHSGGAIAHWAHDELSRISLSSCFIGSLALSFHTPHVNPVHYREEQTGRQPTHQNAGQSLDRAEHPARLHQHQIAVANRRIRRAGKIERRFGI